MGDVIRFPIERRGGVASPANVTVQPGWRANISVQGPVFPLECTELVHNFDEVPGRCRCGEHYWDPDNPNAS